MNEMGMWTEIPRDREGRRGLVCGAAEAKQTLKEGRASTSAESTTNWRAKSSLGALTGGAAHRAGNLGEDLADIIRHTRHDRSRRNGDETGHQGVFDQVLALCVFPDFQRNHQLSQSIHVFVPLSISCAVYAATAMVLCRTFNSDKAIP